MDNSNYTNPNGGFDTPAPKKNNNSKVIIIIVAVIAALIVGIICFSLASGSDSTKDNSEKTTTTKTSTAKKSTTKASLPDELALKYTDVFNTTITAGGLTAMDPSTNENFKSVYETMMSTGVKKYAIGINTNNGSSIQLIAANHDIIELSMKSLNNEYSLERTDKNDDYTVFEGTYGESLKTVIIEGYNFILVGMTASDDYYPTLKELEVNTAKELVKAQ